MASDFFMFAGDDKVLEFTVKDANGDAVAITSATIKFEATRSFGKASDVSKTTTSGISITDAAGGTFQVTLADTDTEDLSGVYTYECEVTFSSGLIATVAQGKMTVAPVVMEAT